MKNEITVYIKPVGKPRMTQRDKWAKRPCVLRYWAFSDEFKIRIGKSSIYQTNGELSWKAVFAMPNSWSKSKKFLMKGLPHRQKPDRDNIDKAILDSLFKEDSNIHKGSIEKIWDDGKGERIELEWEL